MENQDKGILIEKLKWDEVDEIKPKLDILRKGERSKKMISVDYRLNQLKKLRAAWLKYEDEIHASNLNDIGQEKFMSQYSTYFVVKNDLDEIINKIHEWAAPRSCDTPAILAPAKSYVIPEPFGVALIMSAWNFQYSTLIMPIAQAIAAGNCVLAKPSEMAESSAVICKKILSELDAEIVQVCQGGQLVCEELLRNAFDIIVFTGSPQKGKLVAKAAAEFLTPCILELGGQNPVIVDKSADIANAAHNIINGRCIGSGQVCLSPEYILVENEIFNKLVEQIKTTLESFYGTDPETSKDYSRIINEFHTERIGKLIDNHGGKLIAGGSYNVKNKYVAPTIVTYDSIDKLSTSLLATGEIFGPILYMAPYNKIEQAIEYINSKDKPLTLYYFGSNNNNKNLIIKNTSSGAFVTNDAIVHFTCSALPFGGVGSSGYGAYHGKWGFDNLSHLKPVLDKKQILVPFRYPPYTDTRKKIMTFLVTKITFSQWKLIKGFAFTILLLSLYLYRNSLINLVKWK